MPTDNNRNWIHWKPFFPCVKRELFPQILRTAHVLYSIRQIDWFRVYFCFVRKLLCNLLIYSLFKFVLISFTSHWRRIRNILCKQRNICHRLLTNIYWMICACACVCVCVKCFYVVCVSIFGIHCKCAVDATCIVHRVGKPNPSKTECKHFPISFVLIRLMRAFFSRTD